MMIWTWQQERIQWVSHTLSIGGEWPLGEAAVLWAIADDILLLFAREQVAVNGIAALPIQRLADRDEMTIGTTTWCVSFDALPAREVFHAIDQPIHCTRCHGLFCQGDAMIVCPQCRACYHDHDELPCWTYGPTCARCGRATAQMVWQPDPLSRSSRRVRHDDTTAPR